MKSTDALVWIAQQDALAPTFLDAVVKGTFLLLLARAITLFRRQTSAALRHMVWCLALAGVLVLPVFSALLPEWRVSWLPNWGDQVTRSSKIDRPERDSGTESLTSGGRGIQPQAVQQAPESLLNTDAPRMTSLEPIPEAGQTARSAISNLPVMPVIAILLWICGVAFTIVPVVIGYFQILMITRRSRMVEEERWQKLLQTTSDELGLRRSVRLLQSGSLNVPVTWGILHPVVLLPMGATSWPQECRRLVLLHELAHVCRWDWLTQTIANIARALYWFNPFVWMAARAIRIEREVACDDVVLRSGTPAGDYADELLKFAAHRTRHGLLNLAAVPMARRSSLEGRLLAILDAKLNRTALSRVVFFSLLTTVAIGVMPVAMLRGADKDNQPPNQATEFGPVIEHRIFDPDVQLADSMVDLDNGKVLSAIFWPAGEAPVQLVQGFIAGALEEVRRRRIDLVSDASGHSLLGLDMVVARVGNEAFGALAARDIMADERLAGRAQTESELTPKEELPATWLIKTREGARGILQIVRFGNHESADIRYKLVQREEEHETAHRPRISTPTADAPGTGQSETLQHAVAYVFDRNFEREMRPEDERSLDLDTGDFVTTVPPGDLLFAPEESDLRVRNGRDMAVVIVASEQWQTASAEDAQRAVANAAVQKQVRLGGEESPQTIFFKTAAGRTGVLQVSPYERKPGSVLVRYKLVRPRREFAESVINLPAVGEKRFLSLKNLKRYSTNPANAPAIQIDNRAPMTSNGVPVPNPNSSPIAYVEKLSGRGWRLIVENAHNYPTEPQAGMKLWESMSAEEISEPAGLAGVPFERKGIYQLREDETPVTVLIPEYGLLQISGFDTRTQQVILTYKQVVNAKSPQEGKVPKEQAGRKL